MEAEKLADHDPLRREEHAAVTSHDRVHAEQAM
jgi:hypothetical protein